MAETKTEGFETLPLTIGFSSGGGVRSTGHPRTGSWCWRNDDSPPSFISDTIFVVEEGERVDWTYWLKDGTGKVQAFDGSTWSDVQSVPSFSGHNEITGSHTVQADEFEIRLLIIPNNSSWCSLDDISFTHNPRALGRSQAVVIA